MYCMSYDMYVCMYVCMYVVYEKGNSLCKSQREIPKGNPLLFPRNCQVTHQDTRRTLPRHLWELQKELQKGNPILCSRNCQATAQNPLSGHLQDTLGKPPREIPPGNLPGKPPRKPFETPSFLSFVHVAWIARLLYTLGGLTGTVCGLVVFGFED